MLAVVVRMKMRTQRKNRSDEIRGVRHQRELQRLMGRLDNQCGIIQRRFFPQRVIQQTMKWRSGIGPYFWRVPIYQPLLKLSIFVSPLHHFTFVLFAPHHFTMWTCVCIMCTISPYFFHHFSVPIHFTILPFHHVNLCVYSLRHFSISVSP